MSENTRNTDIITERYAKGERLKAETLNKIIETLNSLHQRRGNKSADVNLWFRCISDDDADPFSVLEIYDADFDDDEPTLLVRKATADAELYCGNENYPLFASNPGWVKVIHCEPDFVQVRAVGETVAFGDFLDTDEFNVTLAALAAGSSSGSGSFGVTGPLVAMTNERDFDRMVMVAHNCAGIGGFGDTETTGCCEGCRCYPDATVIVTDCTDIPCLYSSYVVIGDLPFLNDGLMAHAGGCVYTSEAFPVTICDCDYGTGTWTLTVAKNPTESTLTLSVSGAPSGSGSGCVGDAFSITYRNKWYFDAICGNTYGKVFECDIPTEIAHLFPCEVCVVAVGEICEPCQGGVSSLCCPDGYSLTYLATLSCVSCPTIDGISVTLTYVPGTIYWEGALPSTGLADCSGSIVQFRILGLLDTGGAPSCNSFAIVYKNDPTTGVIWQANASLAPQCPIVSRVFMGDWDETMPGGGCCPSPPPPVVTITITPT